MPLVVGITDQEWARRPAALTATPHSWCSGMLRRMAGAWSIAQESFTLVTVGMNYRVLPGKQRDFEEKFASVIGALRSASGHTNSTLWKDVSDDASYLITSEWSDEQAFRDFIQSDTFRDVTNWGKEQILSGRPQHKVYKH